MQLIQHLFRLAVRLVRHLRKQPRFQDLSLALKLASAPSKLIPGRRREEIVFAEPLGFVGLVVGLGQDDARPVPAMRIPVKAIADGRMRPGQRVSCRVIGKVFLLRGAYPFIAVFLVVLSVESDVSDVKLGHPEIGLLVDLARS